MLPVLAPIQVSIIIVCCWSFTNFAFSFLPPPNYRSGLINQSLLHPSLVYLYNSSNYINNGNNVHPSSYGQPPPPPSSPNCNTSSSKAFLPNLNCDTSNNNATLNSNNEHVINIQKQIIKQLLDSGYSEVCTLARKFFF